MSKRKNITTNRNREPISTQKPEKNILASATIRHGVDTNILDEDLYREYQKDKGNTDLNNLVNDKWVRFYDRTSSFLKGLMALVQNSTTLRSIIGKKVSLILGDGFVPISSDKVPFLQTLRKFFRIAPKDDAAIEAINELIGNINLNNDTLEEVIEMVAFDWESFGNAIVELVRTTRNGEDIVMMYHLPLNQVGIKKANNNNIIEAIGVCDNWDNDSTDESAIREIPLYPVFNEDGRSAIHIKNYAPSFIYWGLPENIAGRFWAEVEYRIPKYNISKFKNKFKPSAWIRAYGNFTDTEADTLVDSIKEFFTDTDNDEKALVQVMRSKEEAADITLFESKSEGDYIELQALATQAIVTANQWTMSLAGMATAGKLGSNQQIRDELEFVTNTNIKKSRRKIVQSIINPFVKENSILNPVMKGIMLKIANMNPISLASLLDPKVILTTDEMREIYGYDAIGGEDGDTIGGKKTDTATTAEPMPTNSKK